MSTSAHNAKNRAIALLQRSADVLKQSYTVGGAGADWSGFEAEKADYDEHLAVIDALSRQAPAAPAEVTAEDRAIYAGIAANYFKDAAPTPAEPAKTEARIPRQATPEMRHAFRQAYREGGFWSDRLDYALDRMLQAIPTPPTPEAEPVQQDTKPLRWYRVGEFPTATTPPAEKQAAPSGEDK